MAIMPTKAFNWMTENPIANRNSNTNIIIDKGLPKINLLLGVPQTPFSVAGYYHSMALDRMETTGLFEKNNDRYVYTNLLSRVQKETVLCFGTIPKSLRRAKPLSLIDVSQVFLIDG